VLTILGGGIAGSWAYRSANARGIPVRLVADDVAGSASSVALAVLHSKDDTAERAVAAYRRHGIPVVAGAVVSSYRRPDARIEDGWWAVNPRDALITPRESDTDPVASETEWFLDCRASPTWGSTTFGATWVHENPAALSISRLHVHQDRPYHDLAAMPWPDGARLGSTVATTLASAVKQADRLMATAYDLGWVAQLTGWRLLAGRRVKAYEPVGTAGGLARFGGFHRDGYTTAALFADAAVDLALSS
jgi:hypothetical protein